MAKWGEQFHGKGGRAAGALAFLWKLWLVPDVVVTDDRYSHPQQEPG